MRKFTPQKWKEANTANQGFCFWKAGELRVNTASCPHRGVSRDKKHLFLKYILLKSKETSARFTEDTPTPTSVTWLCPVPMFQPKIGKWVKLRQLPWSTLGSWYLKIRILLARNKVGDSLWVDNQQSSSHTHNPPRYRGLISMTWPLVEVPAGLQGMCAIVAEMFARLPH